MSPLQILNHTLSLSLSVAFVSSRFILPSLSVVSLLPVFFFFFLLRHLHRGAFIPEMVPFSSQRFSLEASRGKQMQGAKAGGR